MHYVCLTRKHLNPFNGKRYHLEMLLDTAPLERCAIKASPSSEAVNILNWGGGGGRGKGKVLIKIFKSSR